MIPAFRYWKLLRLDALNGGRSLPVAESFLQGEFPAAIARHSLSASQNTAIYEALMALFRGDRARGDRWLEAKAGLCLRCYVSYPVVRACRQLAGLFGGGGAFDYRELLPFVLDDDGEAMAIVDRDGKQQQRIDRDGQIYPASYSLFTVDILRTFDFQSASRLSLDNWAYLQTKQNKALKGFLADRGFQYLSDWALLNKAREAQLALLPGDDRLLVDVFHAVYRRDRRLQPKSGGRCPDPSEEQLQEMSDLLRESGRAIALADRGIVRRLKQIAKQLRQYEIWSRRGAPVAEPLEAIDPETGDYGMREFADPNSTPDLQRDREQEFLARLHDRLPVVLDGAIASAIGDRIAALQKSRNYRIFADKAILGWQLLYCEGLSQREIVDRLGMTNQSQVSRVLNPKELLSRVRFRTLEGLLEAILEFREQFGLGGDRLSPEVLENIQAGLEEFIDRQVFEEAFTEMKAGNNRSFESLYAKRLQFFLQECR
ncbi:hypothetical protein JJD41_20875 [Oxynema sp. CENA135]|uniref:hypothetical protein n=1 Tax=Oxynema sp. CENA135 TaxID=984206 RepID=UPI00190D804C|nr:hypothetical protein [Oxynema sp. CENA135]MBK4732300.1 hypothetical protein [Oxynema sp. CENA135]